METRSGATPKPPKAMKKRTIRNPNEPLNFGGHSPPNNRNQQVTPMRPTSNATSSSVSVPPTPPLLGFAPNDANQNDNDVNDNVIEMNAQDQEIDELMRMEEATNDQPINIGKNIQNVPPNRSKQSSRPTNWHTDCGYCSGQSK